MCQLYITNNGERANPGTYSRVQRHPAFIYYNGKKVNLELVIN